MRPTLLALYSSSTINWRRPVFSPELVAQIRSDPAVYRNLWGDSFWRAMMTDEERKMRRHANRGHRWIPHRIIEMRNNYRYGIIQAIFPQAEPRPRSNFNTESDCINCGLTHEEMRHADKLMEECLEPHRNRLTWRDEEEWEVVVAQCLAEVTPQVHPSARSPIKEQERGSVVSWRYFPFGLCPSCFEGVRGKAQQLVALVLDSSLTGYEES